MIDARIVPLAKVRDYLLDPAHEHGGPKSVFFEAHGFRRERHEDLSRALIEHFESNTQQIFDTPFGRKYVVDAPLRAPDGRRPMLRSVWIARTPGDPPTFVTAVPRSAR